jgi:malate-CoA ligase subunit alpha
MRAYRYCVCVTDGIPAQDMIRVKRFMRRYKAENRMILTGPNCAGTISPGKAMMGIMPPHIYLPGRVGIVGRSGTLGYEAASQMKELGIGVSTSVGIGGDPINGSSFRDILELFENDPDTDAVLMIGEIGGPQEAEAARIARDHMKQAGVAYVAGLSAPKGRRWAMPGRSFRPSAKARRKRWSFCRRLVLQWRPTRPVMGETVAAVLKHHKIAA